MKKFFFRPLMILALALGMSVPVLADTIRLKDGSIIRGQILGFKDEQFTILVGAGSRGRKTRINIYMEDVESIEFDAGNRTSTSDTAGNTQPTYQPPRNTPTNAQPTYQPPSNQPTNSRSIPSSNRTSDLTFFQVNSRVRADNSTNGWTNTGLVVRRGQRLRISATGRVSLGRDVRTGQQIWSTADGLKREDREKLMRNQPTGGLIAVIGDDNDDFIFIGSSHDFVAQRDGILFMGVNEGNLSDNSETFDVVIEAENASANSQP